MASTCLHVESVVSRQPYIMLVLPGPADTYPVLAKLSRQCAAVTIQVSEMSDPVHVVELPPSRVIRVVHS